MDVRAPQGRKFGTMVDFGSHPSMEEGEGEGNFPPWEKLPGRCPPWETAPMVYSLTEGKSIKNGLWESIFARLSINIDDIELLASISDRFFCILSPNISNL